MRILVHHQGQQLGPFTIDELRAALAAGKVSPQDLAWWEGQSTWVPTASVPGLGMVATGGPSPVVSGPAGPSPVVSGPVEGADLAMWSLILGILSLVMCGFISGIPAIICGHMALARKKRAGVEAGKGMAIAGLATGYAGTILYVLMAVIMVIAIAIPAMKTGKSGFSNMRSGVTEMTAHVNAQVISSGLLSYASSHDGKFPDTLQALIEEGLLDSQFLTDPFAPQFGADGFLYFPPSKNDDGDKVILAGRGKNSEGKRVVARKDGRVEMLKYSLPADL